MGSAAACRLLGGPFFTPCCGTLLRGGKALPIDEASLPRAKVLRMPAELLIIELRGENELHRLGGGASRLFRRHADSSGWRRVGMLICRQSGPNAFGTPVACTPCRVTDKFEFKRRESVDGVRMHVDELRKGLSMSSKQGV